MDSEDQRDEPEPTYQDYLDEQERVAHLWEEELRETLERLEPLGVLEGLSDDHQLSLAAVFWDAEYDFSTQENHEHLRREWRKIQVAVSRRLKSANFALSKAQVALGKVLTAIDADKHGRWRVRGLRTECAALRDSIAARELPVPVLHTGNRAQEVLQKIRDDLQATFRGFRLGKGEAAVRTAKITKEHFGDSVQIDDHGKSVPAFRIAEKRKKKASPR